MKRKKFHQEGTPITRITFMKVTPLRRYVNKKYVKVVGVRTATTLRQRGVTMYCGEATSESNVPSQNRHFLQTLVQSQKKIFIQIFFLWIRILTIRVRLFSQQQNRFVIWRATEVLGHNDYLYEHYDWLFKVQHGDRSYRKQNSQPSDGGSVDSTSSRQIQQPQNANSGNVPSIGV